MYKYKDFSFFLLRVSMGWLMFYAGITKVLDPTWSAKGYLLGAKTFSGFFNWLASPGILPTVNFLNEWGLTLLGVSLLLGALVRWSSIAGVVLTLLYYFPILDFPLAGHHGYIIDDHIIYALVLLLFVFWPVGRIWGLDSRLAKYLPV